MSLRQHSVSISQPGDAGEARRLCYRLAELLKFDDAKQGEIAIVVTELARNLLLHGRGGEIIFSPRTDGRESGIDILVLDKGPGIADIAKCLQDGYSTAGTQGTGMGAVLRLSQTFEIFTQPGAGTGIFVRVLSAATQEDPQDVGAVCLPVQGEEECGDAWAVKEDRDRRLMIVADGLGHGSLAAEASREAIVAFQEHAHQSPGQILQVAHERLRKTRGAAVAVAEVNWQQQMVHYAGIGNIAGAILGEDFSRSMVSFGGIVGHNMPQPREFTYPWKKGSLLIMNSDGLTSRWSLENYRGLLTKHPALIAGVLYRDFKRGRDDSTVVVAREAA